MWKSTGIRLERRRWLSALFALCVVAGLQLAVLPEGLAAPFDGCFMACSVEDRTCCCKKLAGFEPPDPHVPEAEAFGRWVASEPLCRDLCATFVPVSASGAWLHASFRHEVARPEAMTSSAPSSTSFRALEHDDPSTLPRPPPVSTALL